MTTREADTRSDVINNNNNLNEDDDDSKRKFRPKDRQESEGNQQNLLRSVPTNDDDDDDQIDDDDDEDYNYRPCTRHRTVGVEDVALVVREPYIRTGYRLPNKTWGYYLASVCWLHNESVNVWTHLVGCVLLVAHAAMLGAMLDGFRDPRAGLVVAFALTCFFSNLFSSAAHLLHSRSARHHYLFYFIDYAGISIYNFGNGIDALFSCSTAEQYHAVKDFFLPVLMVGCYVSFFVILLARLKFQGTQHDRKRKVLMTGIYLVLLIVVAWPVVARYVGCFRDDDCSVGSLHHITIIFVFYVLDGVSFTALLPEKLRPGTFDVWGHSHQWFHVLVMATQQLQLYALHVDYVQRGRARHVTTSVASILVTLLVLMLAQVVTIQVMMPAIRRKVAEGSKGQSEDEEPEVPVDIDIDAEAMSSEGRDIGESERAAGV